MPIHTIFHPVIVPLLDTTVYLAPVAPTAGEINAPLPSNAAVMVSLYVVRPLVPADPDVPADPEVPELPFEPEVPELPFTPLDPEVPLTPEVPLEPVSPEDPLVPLVPETAFQDLPSRAYIWLLLLSYTIVPVAPVGTGNFPAIATTGSTNPYPPVAPPVFIPTPPTFVIV